MAVRNFLQSFLFDRVKMCDIIPIINKKRTLPVVEIFKLNHWYVDFFKNRVYNSGERRRK